ncbi:MAG TPA: hypothetical protein V6C89_03425 [Drouetiella sp.]|jgi:hypothetical protein
MKFRPILMIAAMCISTVSASLAATKPLDKDFLTFWTGFKAALQKNDKKAIASMTKLPYMMDEKKLNEAAFIAQSEKVFPADVRKCLLHGKPIADKDCVMVFCDEEIYIFVKDQGKYKFSEIGVND